MKILFLSDFVPKKKLFLDEKFVSLIEQSDKVVFNLEGTYTKQGQKLPLMPFYKEDLLSFLNRFTPDKFIIALANNHILDNGCDTFDSLIDLLKDNKIKYVGTKEYPYLILENIAILNFVTAETLVDYKAKDKLNYIFLNENKINSQIEYLEKNICGQLILYPHWGRDMDKKRFKTYSFKIDKPRWLIYGHHSHIISNLDGNNIYSLGNTFIPHPYYYRQYPATKYGLAIILNTKENETKTYITIVTSADDYQENFSLNINSFDKLPEILERHVDNFSKVKKIFLKLFAFSGNGIMDFIRLIFLRFILIFFKLKFFLKTK